MDRAVITSTYRTPEEQAKIMLKNAKIDLAAQYRLYGRKGDSVLKIYADNKEKSDTEIIKLMTNKIQEIAESGSRVSKHCVPVESQTSSPKSPARRSPPTRRARPRTRTIRLHRPR